MFEHILETLERGEPLSDAEVIVAKGPFDVEAETALMQEHAVDVLVTKNSGGVATAAKLTAARLLHLPVVIVERPPNPPGEIVPSVDELLSQI